jgi:hypothetical protein
MFQFLPVWRFYGLIDLRQNQPTRLGMIRIKSTFLPRRLPFDLRRTALPFDYIQSMLQIETG